MNVPTAQAGSWNKIQIKAMKIIDSCICPECGGELECWKEVGHELKDGDYYTPNSYVIDYFIYRCADCGEIFKSEKEL